MAKRAHQLKLLKKIHASSKKQDEDGDEEDATQPLQELCPNTPPKRARYVKGGDVAGSSIDPRLL